MRRISAFSVIVLCASLAAFAAQPAKVPRHPSQLKLPEGEFKPRRAEEAVLSNGIRVFLMRDDETPVLRVQMYFPGGSWYEPKGREGLADLTATVMRQGGVKSLPMEAFQDELEQRAVDMWVGAGSEMLTAGFTCLERQSDWAFGIFAELLREPLLPEKTFGIERGKMLEAALRRWDSPGTQLSDTFDRLLYGADDPRGRQPGQKSLQAITAAGLKEYHRRYFAPDHALLGLRGRFEREEMLARLEAAFGSWPRNGAARPQPLPVPPAPERAVYYVHRPGLKQTNIRMGHFGVDRMHPDLQKIEVMNFIFGNGGMAHRLFRTVRSERGYAYSVRGGVGSGTGAGVTQVSCQTKPGSTLETIETILAEMEKIRREPPSAEEVMLAHQSIANSFVFQFEDAGDVLQKSMQDAFFGYPAEYWDGYLARVRAATAQDAQAMASAHMRPQEMITVILGDESLFGRPLSDLGEVKRLNPEDFRP